jgi:rare lipoprotein A
MNSTSFRTARQTTPMPVRKFGIGILMMGLALTASAKDATTVESPSGKIQVPDPQAPINKTVHMSATRAKHWLEVGVASWYGSHFQGRKTAAGEKYDMNLMTCAHPTLPMGTWLRVTNLKNHKTAFVRVNDRGPLVEGRIVDLSYAAAQTLGLTGLGHVKLEAVRENDPDLVKALVAQLQFPVVFDPLMQQ